MDEHFPILKPPAGGLARLQQRLDEPGGRRWLPLLVGVPSLAVALALVLLALRPTPPPPPVRALEGTAVQLVSTSDQVVMVRVASLAPEVP